jgi:hypothetical protein
MSPKVPHADQNQPNHCILFTILLLSSSIRTQKVFLIHSWYCNVLFQSWIMHFAFDPFWLLVEDKVLKTPNLHLSKVSYVSPFSTKPSPSPSEMTMLPLSYGFTKWRCLSEAFVTIPPIKRNARRESMVVYLDKYSSYAADSLSTSRLRNSKRRSVQDKKGKWRCQEKISWRIPWLLVFWGMSRAYL